MYWLALTAMESGAKLPNGAAVVLLCEQASLRYATGKVIKPAKKKGRIVVELDDSERQISVKESALLNCNSSRVTAELLGVVATFSRHVWALSKNVASTSCQDDLAPPDLVQQREFLKEQLTRDNQLKNIATIRTIATIDKIISDAASDRAPPSPISGRCVLCLGAKASYACTPCGHLVACAACAPALSAELHCPMCRAVFAGLQIIYF